MKNTIKGLALITIIMLIMIMGAFSKENIFKKKEVKNHDNVVEYVYETYYSDTQLKKSAYEFKTYWKNNELQYVTEYHYSNGLHHVAIFDKNLKFVDGKASSEYEWVWEDANKLIGEL